ALAWCERGDDADRLLLGPGSQGRDDPVAVLLDRVIDGAAEAAELDAVAVARYQFRCRRATRGSEQRKCQCAKTSGHRYVSLRFGELPDRRLPGISADLSLSAAAFTHIGTITQISAVTFLISLERFPFLD